MEGQVSFGEGRVLVKVYIDGSDEEFYFKSMLYALRFVAKQKKADQINIYKLRKE